MPGWLNISIAVAAALGLKELISYIAKGWAEERKAKKLHKLEQEDVNDRVLLDTIEDMRKDIERQKQVEVELREKLSDERADKVRYRTKLEMILDTLEKQVDDE